jgi:hypothetical protein
MQMIFKDHYFSKMIEILLCVPYSLSCPGVTSTAMFRPMRVRARGAA